MTREVLINEGAFDQELKNQVNANFEELYKGFPALADAEMKVAEISLGAAELGGSETNTSFVAPANGMILVAAWIKVTDAESGTIDVGTQGTSNDPDGILDGVSVATLGYVGQVPAAKGALLGCFIPADDPVSVTSSGDLNSCEATLYLQYIELPAV